MVSNTNPFGQHAESMQNHPDSPDTCNTKESSITEGVEANEALPPPYSASATSSKNPESRQHFPEHLPYRVPQQPIWIRFWRNNKLRVAVGIFCFVVVVGGTVAGAFFLANFIRTGMFYPGSGADVRNATRTSHVTVTTVVPGLGEIGPVTETISSMQETRLSTYWVVLVPKTTTTPVQPTKPAGDR